MADSVMVGELQARIRRHNTLTDKYRVQVEALRGHVEIDADVWDVLLRTMLAQTIDGVAAGAPEEETLQTVALDFGFQCMGVGAVLAMDALAQEDIVI